MTEKNKSKRIEAQAIELVQKAQEVEEKIEAEKGAVVAQKSKVVNDEVTIEIIHALKEIIIEFIHRKYPIPSE